MEESRKAERWARSFRLIGQNSEESTVPEEDETIISHLRDSQLFANLSSASSELPKEDRRSYYARKYPSAARLEEACRKIEEENELESNNSNKTSRRRLNFSFEASYSSDTLMSDSSTVAASDSGYDAEDSMSTTVQTINNFLDSCINDSVTNSSSHAGCLQDSLLNESSSSSTQTSYMELKDILLQLSISEQNREICSDKGIFNQYQNQLFKTLNRLPQDFKVGLKTILEDSSKISNPSIDDFKSFVLNAINKNQSVHDEMGTYSIHKSSQKSLPQNSVDSSASSVKMFNSTGSSKIITTPEPFSGSLHLESAKSAELNSCDLNESSFTSIEKLCMEDELPRTPKPMPALTEEQKKALELCRKQELELMSESPFSTQSHGSKSKSGGVDGDSRKARSLVRSAVRGAVSTSLVSLSDWDIKNEVKQADRQQSWITFRKRKDEDDKMKKSYAEEFMDTLHKHFDESDRSKSPSGFNESSCEAAPIRGTTSLKASKLSSRSLMAMKKGDGFRRNMTTGFVKKKSLIPRYRPEASKSATMSTAKVSCIRSLIYSMSKVESRTQSRTPMLADRNKNVGTSSVLSEKSAPSLLTPDWVGRSGSKSGGIFNAGHSISQVEILVTCPTPEVICSHCKSPGAKNYGKFERRYFCTPGRAPVAKKKKKIFFPTPEKKTMPRVITKSPVGAYIHGDLSASLIASTRRVFDEFLDIDKIL